MRRKRPVRRPAGHRSFNPAPPEARLKYETSLGGWSLLKEELLELSGNDPQPAEYSAHDDLAIATGLAAWVQSGLYPPQSVIWNWNVVVNPFCTFARLLNHAPPT